MLFNTLRFEVLVVHAGLRGKKDNQYTQILKILKARDG